MVLKIIKNKDGTEMHLLYENNRLIECTTYKNGVKNGVNEEYENGNKIMECYYENGKKKKKK